MSHQGGQQAGHQSPTPNFTNMSNTGSYTTPDKINAPTFTNPPFKGLGGTTAPVPSDGLIQRGYMRLLTEVFEYGTNGTPIGDVGGALSHDLGTKLDFQFNPSELTRSVAARTDTQLWINQSPSQLLQPGIGDMSFSWQMLFNRETEVQKGDVAGRLKKDWEFETVGSRLDAFSKENAASADEAAEELGVLADIAILDRITGQSISAEAIQYAQDRYNRLVASGAITEEDKVDIDTDSIVAMAESKGVSLKEANVQNSAFLVPNPIRVVFSENFMVDGYVNSVTVSFKKFSTQMVPTVALVDVSMHAIYQGFSRYNSTFTTILDLSQDEKEPKEGPPPAGTLLASSYDAAQTSAVLGGFDHSPPLDRSWWEGADNVPLVSYTKLNKHKYAKDVGSKTVDGTTALPFQIENGIAFGIISSLKDGTDLATELRKQYKGQNLPVSELNAVVSTGLRIHARLRPNPSGGAGALTSPQMLKALTEDANAADNGFADHVTDSVFFGAWPLAQRRMLLGSGDGMDSPPVPQSRSNYDLYLAQENSTRSFPITVTNHHGDTYGDLLDMFSVEYHEGEVLVSDDWIWLEWRDRDQERKWKEEDTLYFVGKGFYNSGSVGSESFPSDLTIPHNTNSAKNLLFEVDYQMHVLFRVKLKQGPALISDTGWRRVHPRSTNTVMLPEGGVSSWMNHKTMNLKGNLEGNITATNLLDNRFPWMHDQRGTELHFDGHIGASNGCAPWSHQNTSKMVTNSDTRLNTIGVYISSKASKTQGYA